MTRIFVVALLCSRVSLLIALERSEEIINLCWERNSEGFLLHCLNLFFLGSTLKVNPEERLSITELVNQLQEIAAARNVNPKSPITEVKMSHKEYYLLVRSPFSPLLSSECEFSNRCQKRYPVP